MLSVLLNGDFNDMMRRKVHSRENPVHMKSATEGLPGESTVSYARDRGCRDQQVLCTVCSEL